MLLSSILFWYWAKRGELEQIVLQETVWANGANGAHPVFGEQPPDPAIAICPIQPRAGYLAAAVVPDQLDGNAAVNGILLKAGTHCLRHADRLEISGNSYWIAANSLVDVVFYDPAVQGENQFCFITKAPLLPQQEIVLCPGTPGHPCGQIYAKTSWDRLMQSPNRMRCARCGFHPEAARWSPPETQSKRNIDELLSSITSTA
jgi:hypothetical protein